MSHTKESIFSPASLGALSLRNRLIRTACFEGMCPDGVPSPALIEHHRNVAAGGIGMTTVAYCSVSPSGRTYETQILMRPEIAGPLRQLTGAVHEQGAKASIQLGHCGYFASKKVIGEPVLGASKQFNLYGLSMARPMTENDIRRITSDFSNAAALAVATGFDAVELHLGHGYLLSQFMSPYTNHRTDAFGGSLDNRLRFPCRVLEAVKQAVGPQVPVLLKVNLTDGFKGGFSLAESVEAAKRFEALGADALVLSGGFVSKTSLYMLRGNVPTVEMARAQKRWFHKMGLLLFGKLFVKTYPFSELFFLEDALEIRRAVRLPLVLLGGVVSIDNMIEARQQGFDFLALGRALIRNPAFPNDLALGNLTQSDCDHCNRCIAEMDAGGVKCVCNEAQARPGTQPHI